MIKLNIVEENGYYTLHYDWTIINFSFVVKAVYGGLIPNKNTQCRRLLKKFNINTVFSISSRNRADLEHFSKFLESRCSNG